jgi:phage-related tail protein
MALNLLAQARDKDAEAIRANLDTGEKQLQQMRDELMLLNMKTQAERDFAAFKIANPTATDDQANAAVSIQKQIDETREAISAMDEFRSSFEDFVVAAANGKASFKDFADMVIQQIFRMGAAALTAKLFGDPGTSGGGLFGGLLAAFFGSGSSASVGTGVGSGITVPGYASGTDFAPGGFALVGERGPELVHLPRGSQVTPNNRLGSMGNTINITVAGNATRETAQQIANQVGRKLIFAGRGT